MNRRNGKRKGLRRRQMLLGLKLAFGSVPSPAMVFMVVLAVMATAWAADSVYAMLFASSAWAGLTPLAALLALFLLVSRRMESLAPSVRQQGARPARALVMFLSQPGKNPRETASARMGSWRMALEAIAHHHQRGTLERVALIPSADSGANEDGTFRFVDDFREVMWRKTGCPADTILIAPGCTHGVDYENAQELAEALERALDWLAEDGFAANEMMIDITGGQKPGAAVAAVFGLGEGRRVQYVSTRSYQVIEYDMTLE